MCRRSPKIFLAISLAVIVILTDPSESLTPVRKCNNEKALPLMVQIDGCENLPCDFTKGRQSDIAIQFVATKNSMNGLHADVRLTTLGVELPFELEANHGDVCGNLLFGAYCPLDAGEDVTYNLIIHIHEQQPAVPVKLEVNLLDDSDNSVVACFVIDGRVRRH